jgi:hypothetical protein
MSGIKLQRDKNNIKVIILISSKSKQKINQRGKKGKRIEKT